MKKLHLIIIFIYAANFSFASNGDTLIVNPNPFDSIAVIHFEIANTDTIWLNVFNIVGSNIKTIFSDTVLSSGTYTLNFNGDTLPNGIYFVRLKINSTKTITVKLIKDNNAVGLKENYLLKNIEVYPNPCNFVLNINVEQNELQNSTIEIRNPLEQIAISIPFANEIDISSLTSGIYFLTVQNKTSIKSIKIIKE